MKNKTKIKWALCAVAGALAVMGLCFAWKCPLDCIYGENSGVFLFKKQLLWNAIGIAACVGAALTPWRRWLKLAPWSMLVWFVLMVVAVGFSPARHGSHRWADFGVVTVNIHLVLVLAWALFTAWLCSKKCIKPWMVFAFMGVLLAVAAVHVLGNANRMMRLCAVFGYGDGNAPWVCMQNQMKAAYAAANWFGDADRSLRYLPISHAVSMPSAAALLFGKSFTLAIAALFAALGGLLTYMWIALKNPSKQMFIFFWGGAMVFSAFYSLFQSVGLLSTQGFTLPLAGYGGALAVTFYLGFGIVLSALSEATDYVDMSRGRVFAIGGVWAVLFAIFVFGVAAAPAFRQVFVTPYPNQNAFGEFGMQAKRGEIFAADGSVLARSVKRYDVRIDPKIAREHKIAFNSDSVDNICQRLKLTHAELLDFCASEKSRYLLVRSNVEESIAKWFKSKEGRRLAKGFIIETVQRREYPLGSNAVHVTGCASRNTSTGIFGCTGVESVCDSILAGRSGRYLRSAGRAEQLAQGRPLHGGSVTTTIVPKLQNALADILLKAVATNGSETAWGIVMNATNGAIAAMASLPTYDPSGVRHIKDNDAPDYFMNNAAMANYEPGCIMKPITFAIALDKGCLKSDAKIDHGDGVWEYGGVKLYDIPGATGVLSVVESLARRTDIGAAKVSAMLWEGRDFSSLLKFGFGSKVAGRTVYGEEAGIVRPAIKCAPVTLSRIGIGRGIAVTGLQIVNAYAILANGGLKIYPHLIDKTISTNGIESVFGSKTESVRVVSEDASKEIAKMMVMVMREKTKEYSIDFGGVDVAGMIAKCPIVSDGKYSKTEFNVLFAGFFPADNPKWVVAIGFSKPKGRDSTGSHILQVFDEIVHEISLAKEDELGTLL